MHYHNWYISNYEGKFTHQYITEWLKIVIQKAVLKSNPKKDNYEITQKVAWTLITGTEVVVVDTLSVVADEDDLERLLDV